MRGEYLIERLNFASEDLKDAPPLINKLPEWSDVF
jgi:hypothetical protein